MVFNIYIFTELSAMIAGADNGTDFIVREYAEPDAETIFKDFFKWRSEIF